MDNQSHILAWCYLSTKELVHQRLNLSLPPSSSPPASMLKPPPPSSLTPPLPPSILFVCVPSSSLLPLCAARLCSRVFFISFVFLGCLLRVFSCGFYFMFRLCFLPASVCVLLLWVKYTLFVDFLSPSYLHFSIHMLCSFESGREVQALLLSCISFLCICVCFSYVFLSLITIPAPVH